MLSEEGISGVKFLLITVSAGIFFCGCAVSSLWHCGVSSCGTQA